MGVRGWLAVLQGGGPGQRGQQSSYVLLCTAEYSRQMPARSAHTACHSAARSELRSPCLAGAPAQPAYLPESSAAPSFLSPAARPQPSPPLPCWSPLSVPEVQGLAVGVEPGSEPAFSTSAAAAAPARRFRRRAHHHQSPRPAAAAAAHPATTPITTPALLLLLLPPLPLLLVLLLPPPLSAEQERNLRSTAG